MLNSGMEAATQGRRTGDGEEVRMTFGEHLEELRKRLFISVIALTVTVVAGMFFRQILVTFVTRPHFRAMDLIRKDLERNAPKPPEEASASPEFQKVWKELEEIKKGNARLIPSGYAMPILQDMKLIFVVALFAASPIIGYQLWAFISAGLYRDERKYVTRFAPASFLLFVAGCAFGYFVLIPYCLYGLAQMYDPEIMSMVFSYPDYIGLVMALTIILGAIFQVPLLMIFFSMIGLVQPSTYNKWQRAMLVTAAVGSALITPTADPITMLMVMVPIIVLYEIGVVASYLLVKPSLSVKT